MDYLTSNRTIIETGQQFLITGYYSYYQHLDGKPHSECFVPEQSSKMLFKKGEKAPTLGSCSHIILWILFKEIVD